MQKNNQKIPYYLQAKQQKEAIQAAIGSWTVRNHELCWKNDFILIDNTIKIDDENIFKDISKKYKLKKPGIFLKSKFQKEIKDMIQEKLKNRLFIVKANIPGKFKKELIEFLDSSSDIFCGYNFKNNIKEIWSVDGKGAKYIADILEFDINFNEITGNVQYKKYIVDKEKWISWSKKVNDTINKCSSKIEYLDGPGIIFGKTSITYNYYKTMETKEFCFSNIDDINEILEFDCKFTKSIDKEKEKILGSYITRAIVEYCNDNDSIFVDRLCNYIIYEQRFCNNKYNGFLYEYKQFFPAVTKFLDILRSLKKFNYLEKLNGLGAYKLTTKLRENIQAYDEKINNSLLESKILSDDATDVEMEKMLDLYKNGLSVNPDVVSAMCENFVFMALNDKDVMELMETT